MMDTRVFKDRQRRDAFWSEIRNVFNNYPEIMNGMNDIYDNEDVDDMDRLDRRKEFDPDSPKFIYGSVLIVSITNLDGDETSFTIAPFEQQKMVTKGLVTSAFSNI